MSLDGRPSDSRSEDAPPPPGGWPATAEPPQFSNVRALLDGTLSTPSRHPSLVFCSMHRCGSSFAGGVLHALAARFGIAPVDLAGYVHNLPLRSAADRLAAAFRSHFIRDDHTPAPPGMAEQFAAIIRPVGAFYGPFRAGTVLAYLPAIESLKVLILLRDPRDALTSHYYWTAFGQQQRLNYAAYEARRQAKLEYSYGSVDDYVLSKSTKYVRNYKTYCAQLAAQPNFSLTRYEDMVADFPGWLGAVWTIWDLPPDRRARLQFAKQVNFAVGAEDAAAHKRQVTPGDHRRKLKPETIARLNELFKDELEFLGYTADGRIVPPTCRTYHAPLKMWSDRIPWLGKVARLTRR